MVGELSIWEKRGSYSSFELMPGGGRGSRRLWSFKFMRVMMMVQRKAMKWTWTATTAAGF